MPCFEDWTKCIYSDAQSIESGKCTETALCLITCNHVVFMFSEDLLFYRQFEERALTTLYWRFGDALWLHIDDWSTNKCDDRNANILHVNTKKINLHLVDVYSKSNFCLDCGQNCLSYKQFSCVANVQILAGFCFVCENANQTSLKKNNKALNSQCNEAQSLRMYKSK